MNEELPGIIKGLCKDLSKVIITEHVRERLEERDIRISEIIGVLSQGEIIEDYPNDYPFPSCLMYRETAAGKPMHVCAAYGDGRLWIVTAYYPTAEYFEEDMKTRKKKEEKP